MKRDDLLIGIGAGLVSAVLFATAGRLTLASVLLFFLTPLPVAIVSLGWTHWSGLLASAAGTLAAGLVFDPMSGLTFALTFALPAWWLSYLALLARQASRPHAETAAPPGEALPDRVWYPLGALAIWAAAIAVVVTLGGAVTLGPDYATYRVTVETMVREALGGVDELSRLGADPALLARLFASVFMPGFAAALVLLLLIIMFLAAKLVAISGRLPRPMPRVAREFALSRASLLGFAGSFVLALFAGWPRFVAIALAASLALLLAIQGLATAHILLARVPARPVILGVGYAMIIAEPWLLIGAALLGLVEMALSLRLRALAAARRDLN